MTPWTVYCQAPLSMGFPSKNTGADCYFLFQGIFPIQPLNTHLLCLLHWQVSSLPLVPPGKPIVDSMCLVTQSCLTLCDPMDCSPPGSFVHGDSPGKNTGMSWHALLQGIFQTQGSNQHLLRLLHWQVSSLPLVPPGKPSHSFCPGKFLVKTIWVS